MMETCTKTNLALLRAAAREVVDDLALLIKHSEGVYNHCGDNSVTPWKELLDGGQWQEWLSSIARLEKVLDTIYPQKEN